MVAGDGFARRREGFKVKNVIGIDTAKDDEVGIRHRVTPVALSDGQLNHENRRQPRRPWQYQCRSHS